MNENNMKIDEKFDEIERLIKKFKNQSEQIYDFKILLENIIDGIKDVTHLCNKSSDDLSDASYELENLIKNANEFFEKEKIENLYSELSKLSNIIEEFKKIRDSLFSLKEDIVLELEKKIESIIIVKQEETERMIEVKFAEVLGEINKLIVAQNTDKL